MLMALFIVAESFEINVVMLKLSQLACDVTCNRLTEFVDLKQAVGLLLAP